MKLLKGKLTREDIIKAGGVTFFTNSTLETRMVLDILRFEMGFELVNDSLKNMSPATFAGEVIAYSDGLLWHALGEKIALRDSAVGTIHNLIPDYVDPMTAQFNKMATRINELEERLKQVEGHVAPKRTEKMRLVDPNELPQPRQ
jgi:hypothetical protein